MISPKKPDLALRIAFAGKRSIGAEAAGLEPQLAALFDFVGARLVATERAGRLSSVSPRLTLVTGLAEGADQIAARAFLNPAAPDSAEAKSAQERRLLGAVLPYERATYCSVSPMSDDAVFYRLLDEAAYVVEPPPLEPAAMAGEKEDHGRPYSAQAEIMLRHADILVAVDDTNPGLEGGTLETTRRALESGMPVVRYVLGSESATILRSLDDLDGVSDRSQPATEPAIAALIDELVGQPRGPRPSTPDLVAEFFGESRLRTRWRQRAWRWFEGRFRSTATPDEDQAAAPFEPYRVRASDLNHHYGALYRGTFLVGYALAVAAVLLAGLSIIVLLRNPSAHSPDYPAWWVLIGLGLAKLVAVIWIQRTSRSANISRWSERAVDYRYLAEALRTMTYLPLAGCFRPPQPLSAPIATRVVVQSDVDRLLHAIVRQADPLKVTPPPDGRNVIHLNPGAAIDVIRSRWLARQLLYHRRNAATMTAMSRYLERLGNALSVAVIAIVSIDLLLLVADGLHLLPEWLSEFVHKAAPWLLFLAAVLPAAVASLNGIRFQSECSRLADRSERMIGILSGLDQRAGALQARAPLHAYGPRLTSAALKLAEDTARITLDEVAEWSAIYAKEFVEP
jgi:hypothetical protein